MINKKLTNAVIPSEVERSGTESRDLGVGCTIGSQVPRLRFASLGMTMFIDCLFVCSPNDEKDEEINPFIYKIESTGRPVLLSGKSCAIIRMEGGRKGPPGKGEEAWPRAFGCG